MKIGDRVIINKGPIDKVGRIGEIVNLFANGAIIKLNNNQFTPIQFSHLEKVEEGEIVNEENIIS